MKSLPSFLAVLLAAPLAGATPLRDSLEIRFFAKVLAAPDSGAALLGITGDGAFLPVRERRPGWVGVEYQGALGWIPSRDAEQGDGPAARAALAGAGDGGPEGPLGTLAAALALASAAALSAGAFLRHRRRYRNLNMTDGPAGRERTVILLARRDTLIGSSMAGLHMPMARCFRELGFQVSFLADPRSLSKALRMGPPGILGVDCAEGPRVLKAMEALGRRHPALKAAVIFFYNADRPESLQPPASLPGAHYLGRSLTSKHLMEMAAPAFEFGPSAEGEPPVCALEGRISRNSLAEILQFLEIGRRTGLLSLEDPNPAGLMVFEDGDITFAQTRLVQGPEAIFDILALKDGSFRFFPDKAAGRGTMRLSATQAVLHWARKMDESGGVPAAHG